MKPLEEMTRQELIQQCVDYRASMVSALKALTPEEDRQGPTDTLHLMQDGSRILNLLFGPQVRFFLLAGDAGSQPGRRANYASTMSRQSAIDTMLEFIREHGSQQDWGKLKL